MQAELCLRLFVYKTAVLFIMVLKIRPNKIQNDDDVDWVKLSL